jgi:hypothetical protein
MRGSLIKIKVMGNVFLIITPLFNARGSIQRVPGNRSNSKLQPSSKMRRMKTKYGVLFRFEF